MPIYKIFCDESCHLEHDKADVMVLGAICVPEEKVQHLNKTIKYMRHQHGYHNEIKWTKLHAKQLDFYKDLIDLFFADSQYQFKTTVVLDKHSLDHETFNRGGHNEFYYKMFYYTLRDFLSRGNSYKIYLDYMDSLGGGRARTLIDVLQASTDGQIDVNAYIIHSHESQLIQLCDLLIGAVAYKNRSDIEQTSAIKNQIIDYLEAKTGGGINFSTPQWEDKFNIFRFLPRKV